MELEAFKYIEALSLYSDAIHVPFIPFLVMIPMSSLYQLDCTASDKKGLFISFICPDINELYIYL